MHGTAPLLRLITSAIATSSATVAALIVAAGIIWVFIPAAAPSAA